MNDDLTSGIPNAESERGDPRGGDSSAGHSCSRCGAAIRHGLRFCPSCGVSLAGAGPSRNRRRVRLVGAGALMVLIPTVIGYWKMTDDRYWLPPLPSEGVPQATTAKTDLTSITPRTAADRLFDRVMRAVVAADVAEVRDFLPMAVAAYGRVDSLGSDGAFHLSTLLRVGRDYHAALMVSQSALEEDPDHVLVLSEAALGALALGDSGAAQSYSRHLLTVYTVQVGRDIDDYLQHRDILPSLQQRAAQIVQGTPTIPVSPHTSRSTPVGPVPATTASLEVTVNRHP